MIRQKVDAAPSPARGCGPISADWQCVPGRLDSTHGALRTGGIRVRHYCPGAREHGGGIGRLIGYIVDAAARRGERHAICDTRGPRWNAPVSLARLLAAVCLMARDRAVAPERIHHIHVAGRGSTARKLVLAAAARGLGCTHLLHLHDYNYAQDFVRRPPWVQRRIRRMFRRADGVIVLGQRDLEIVGGLLGVERAKITIAHNCVPDPGPPTTPTQVADEPTILFLGRLSERKGVPELLDALGSPVMAGLRWRAVLAGDGPVDDYRRDAAALGLAGKVTMPGWLDEDETRELCARSDILVLPSHAEGMAMAVIEGLAHGLAVVTTRVGAHEEAITDGATGVFVPVGDAAALANALARQVSDRNERAKLSRYGRALYLSRFGLEGYMQRLDELYRSVGRKSCSVGRSG
jgi:glycosyltransferase involved in cell wall biosynthesis